MPYRVSRLYNYIISFADSLQKWLSHSKARNQLIRVPANKSHYMFKCVISLSVRFLLFLLLVVAGDVERNPGPLSKEGTAC